MPSTATSSCLQFTMKYLKQKAILVKHVIKVPRAQFHRLTSVQIYQDPRYDRRWNFFNQHYVNISLSRPISIHDGTKNLNSSKSYTTDSSYRILLFSNSIKWKIFIGVVLCSGILFLVYEIQDFKNHLEQSVPDNVSKVGEKAPAVYIYSYPLFENYPWYVRYFPWKYSCETPVWHYIAQTKSPDPNRREEAIKKLVSLKGLTEAEYATIASAIDFKTAVALAHAGAKPSMVARPATLHLDKKNMSIATKFRDILTALPPESIHESIWNASFAALRSFQPTDTEKIDHFMDLSSGFLNEFDTMTPVRVVAEESFLRPCLQALLSHSRITEQIPTMLKNDAMELLLVISQKYKTDHDIMGIVVKILSSFTCCEESDAGFEKSGILRVIAECAMNDDLRLSFPARKALRNLDRENYKYTLPPGLYQVYPDSRDEDKHELDVIFVHGLMGGVFRTWRSQDLNAVWMLKRKAELLRKEGMCDQPPPMSTWQKGADFLRNKIMDGAETNPVHNTIVPPVPNNRTFRERLESQLKSIPLRLLSPQEKDIQPKNREIRNGEMYYFPPEEEIPLELKVLPVSPSSNCWPRDWLPIDFANVRVICADFETFVTHWNPVMPIENLGRTIHERSDELIEKLARAGIGERPIIWVCHSAGGIITKHLLGLVDASDKEELKNIARMTKATVFFSTPHSGSRVSGVGKSGRILLPTVEIIELMKDSVALRKIDTTFQSLGEKYSYKIVSFGELCPTLGSVGISRKLVPVDSSDPGYGDYYGLKVDHLNICKPRSRHSFVYVKICELINSVRSNVGGDDN